MKKPSLLLSLGSLLTLPLPAMAAMTEMADSELADVSGQAYVVQFGNFEKSFPDLTERNVVLVSDAARGVEADFPGLTDQVRQDVMTGANTALGVSRIAVIGSVATVPGVGTLAAPLLYKFLPTPTIRFE
jgi:hypothetical protein